MVSNDEMVLMKVVRIEKTSIKIVSAKSQLSKIAENAPKMASNDEMILMKVEGLLIKFRYSICTTFINTISSFEAIFDPFSAILLS